MRLHDIDPPIPEWVNDTRRWFNAAVPNIYDLRYDPKTNRVSYNSRRHAFAEWMTIGVHDLTDYAHLWRQEAHRYPNTEMQDIEIL